MTTTNKAYKKQVTDDRTVKELIWLRQIFEHADNQNFYGRLTFILEKGRVKRLIKEESLVPPA